MSVEEEMERASGLEVKGYVGQKRRMRKLKDLVEKKGAFDPTGSDVAPVTELLHNREAGGTGRQIYSK